MRTLFNETRSVTRLILISVYTKGVTGGEGFFLKKKIQFSAEQRCRTYGFFRRYEILRTAQDRRDNPKARVADFNHFQLSIRTAPG